MEVNTWCLWSLKRRTCVDLSVLVLDEVLRTLNEGFGQNFGNLFPDQALFPPLYVCASCMKIKGFPEQVYMEGLMVLKRF